VTALNLTALSHLSPAVAGPAYDPASLSVGIVHFGPGAFFRAHQAAYADALAANDPRWGICGVSLHSAGVRDALQPQDGLYTLAVLDETISYSLIGALREVLVAPENPEAVFERLTRPDVRVVTSTVTEKGYCLGAGFRLDFAHPDIAHDAANPHAPKSFIGYMVEALRRRRQNGQAPFILIPCDNLPDNGKRLKAAVAALASASDPSLGAWIDAQLTCPCTMVDSITPATDDALRARVAAATGLSDAWPIQREAFTQWVIEAHDGQDGPDWASVGVTLTDSVPAFERAKLRLLNGPHSSLAYIGSLKGYETVYDAMQDAELAGFVRNLMLEDIAPLLQAPSGMDLPGYCEAILKRFRNPAIRHLLAQIAWDGSQKLPIRILASLQEALDQGRDINRFCLPLAAWMRFVIGKTRRNEPITDPLADKLSALARDCDDSVADVDRFLGLKEVFAPALSAQAAFRDGLHAAYVACLDLQKEAAPA
jgi:fructuronate reductase